MSPLLKILLSASTLTPFILQSTALEGVFADVIMYSDHSCTTLLSAQQIYGPPVGSTDAPYYTQTSEPAFSSFIVASVANIGSISVCEEGCDCDSADCMDLEVQPSEIGFDHCIGVEGVQFDEFRLTAGEINLNVCVNAPCEF
jgi:hypothetical protein